MTETNHRLCQHKSRCDRKATWGVYRWRPGDTTVDLTRAAAVFCGQHKPIHRDQSSYLRNVRIA